MIADPLRKRSRSGHPGAKLGPPRGPFMKTKKKKGSRRAAETCRLPILNATNDALARKPKIQRKLWKAFEASCRKRRITPETGVRMLLLKRMGIAAGMRTRADRTSLCA